MIKIVRRLFCAGGLATLALAAAACTSTVAEPVVLDLTSPYAREVQGRVAAAGMIYPQSAKTAGAQGTVRVAVLLARNGDLIHATVVSSSGNPDLDGAVLKAVRAAGFRPFPPEIQGDQARVIVTVSFRLHR